jgi:hypothetical protein
MALLLQEQPPKAGVFAVFEEFLKRLTQLFLGRFEEAIRALFDTGLRCPREMQADLVRCICLFC